MKRLAIIFALVLGAGLAVPVATSSTPAWALNCSYGDNFYHFWNPAFSQYAANDYSDVFQLIVSLGDAEDNGDLWCQVYTGMPGFTEWVLKSSADCLTLNASAGYEITLSGCQGKASQEWGLVDNLGGENWGGIESGYTNTGYRYMYAQNYDVPVLGATGWNPANSQWNWELVGPYR